MTSSEDSIVSLNGISVDYGSHVGISDVSLNIYRGEILALVGDHGAGKTTITRVLCGSVRPDSGTVTINGDQYEYMTPQRALRLGIVTVHQELTIIPALSAYENLFLNREIRGRWFARDHAEMKRKMIEALRILGVDDIDVHRPIEEYRRDKQQLIELARIICFHSNIVIIDEVSARLSPGILESVHHILSVLRNQGTTVLYISHDMGEVVNFASRIAVLRNGKLTHVVSAADVNEVQLMQLTYSSLRRREDLEADNATLFYQKTFMENILQRLPLPIVVIDTASRIQIANTEFCSFFSVRPEEIIGVDFARLSLLQADFRQEIIDSITVNESGIVTGPSGCTELHVSEINVHFFRLVDAESFLGTVFFFRLESEHGFHTHGVIPTGTTDSNVKRQLRHEISNAMGTILNHIRIAQMNEKHPIVLESISIIEDEIKRISRIVQETTHSCDNGNIVLSIVKKTVALIQTPLQDKSVELVYDVAPDIPIPMHADQLQQILLNLFFNSIDAVRPGGEIQFFSTTTEIGGRPFVEFVVRDNGCGIPEEDVHHVFSPFFSTKVDGSIHGVGLAFCKSMVEESGGSIKCTSTPGVGTTITFLLPLSELPG